MTDEELCYLSIAEASRLIEERKLSPVDLTRAMFKRIEATDGRVHSYVRLMRGSAQREAEASEARAAAGERIGPLDGIPIALKDLFDTAGVVTTAGLWAYRERVPAADATAVRLLREAGAIILGKTNTHEMAYGGTTVNPYYGATHNPWKLDRVPGGSSGGSAAALAAGQCLGAMGTDTAGSIRIPAAFCGVTGHKPTYGLVSRVGVFPLSQTLDHAGPMTRSAEDAAIMLNVLAGFDPDDPDSQRVPPQDFTAGLRIGLAGLKLATVPSLLEGVDAGVLACFEASLEVLRGLGATLGECEPFTGLGLWRQSFSLAGVEALFNAREIYRVAPSSISEATRRRLESVQQVSGADFVELQERRKLIERRFELVMEDWDAILLPTSPMVAEPIEAEVAPADKFRFTMIFDHTRMPAISVPNGLVDGLPSGLQIAGRKWEDATVLRVAHAYQQATDFHRLRPPFVPS